MSFLSQIFDSLTKDYIFSSGKFVEEEDVELVMQVKVWLGGS